MTATQEAELTGALLHRVAPVDIAPRVPAPPDGGASDFADPAPSRRPTNR